jgi:aminoglycoside/choline kinase family phosphotransferase
VLEERRRWVVVESRREPKDDLEDKQCDDFKRKQAEVFAEEVCAAAVLIVREFFSENINSVGQSY